MRVTSLEADGQPIMATWCPGNGTRYDLLFLRFRDAVSGSGRFGRIGAGGWLVVCSLTGRACLLQGHEALDPGYIGSKLGLESMLARVDADVVTEMIGRVTGRPWPQPWQRPAEESVTDEPPEAEGKGVTEDDDAA